ncbi:MAG: phenylalanine--tRNA ligase subunit alpha [Planctomycetota bacterium]
MELPATQWNVLRQLARLSRPAQIVELAQQLGLDQSPILAACMALQDAGFVRIEETPYEELRLDEEGTRYAPVGTGGGAAGVAAALPERVIVGVLRSLGGQCRLTDIPQHCELTQEQVGQSLRWLKERNWAAKAGDVLRLTDADPASIDQPQPDERLLAALAGGRRAARDELAAEGVPLDAALKLLQKRKGFLSIKPRVRRSVALTDAGRDAARTATSRSVVTQLTPELLADGGWRNVDLQPYDVTLAAKKLYPGKEHPFQRTLDRVRRVFLEMGFEEIVSPWVESSFWDFDALFQPQDHPARDMQDTFYVARPDRCRLPDDALVERIRATHENGGTTGSTGWQYRWSRELAHKPVLRTHTTAATMRALAAHASRSVGTWEGGNVRTGDAMGEPPRSHVPTRSRSHGVQPGKYFIIGPVFRRETADYKHLPVFHQVDGIIVDKHASLATLVGTLTAFYGKMGFPKVKVVPSFFPYTEPSAEVHLYMESRRDWVEMGGSGIFRPEVTLPVGITDRVLAWGLGLERLAMLIHGLDAIGDLYFATMPWLREEPLCRA